MPITDDLREDISTLVAEHPVVLFMKGSAQAPKCGFSARAVGILNDIGITFTAVDILQSDDLREGLKEFSDWPTFPQLYVGGEFLGGADIMQEMFDNGELAALLTEGE